MTETWEKISSAVITSNIDTFGQKATIKNVDYKLLGLFTNEQANSDIGTLMAEMSYPKLELKTENLKNIFFKLGDKVEIDNQIFSIIRTEYSGGTTGTTILILRFEDNAHSF